MSTAAAVAAPSRYVSGHCATGRHAVCRGIYAGVTCTCAHHTAPPEPEPDPEPPLELAPSSHCPTCTCGGPRS